MTCVDAAGMDLTEEKVGEAELAGVPTGLGDPSGGQSPLRCGAGGPGRLLSCSEQQDWRG